MSTETHVNPHHEHPDVVGSRNRLGVILLIVADIAFALSMVFTYFYLKAQNVNDQWLPDGGPDHDPISPVSSSGAWKVTAVVALGLLFHFLSLRNARKGNTGSLAGLGFVTFALSVVGLALQISQFGAVPFTFYDGAYASCWYMFAILNVVHLALTAFIALGNWNRARMGLYKSDHWHVDIVNIWWIWMVLSSALGAFSLSFN